MTDSKPKIIRIAQKAEAKVLSKAQKQFNNLIKKIDTQKKLLREWQEIQAQYNQRISSDYEPLLENFNDCRIEFLHLLDSAHDNKAFTKTDKKKLRHLLGEITYDLVFDHGREELKELYNKYADEGDYDSEKELMDESAQDMMKAMVEGIFGVNMGDDIDFSSPEKLQEALKAKLLEQEEQQQAQSKPRKKTAKQLEKEAQKKQDQENISKSIQAVYRKLAGSLHPDREPDETERERKTKLMQKVNTAYAKKDLLQLLELQLEIEQIDESHLSNIAEDRLKHFNKILQEQLNELSDEVQQIAMPFKLQMNVPPYVIFKPKDLMQTLDSDIRHLHRQIKQMHAEIKIAQEPASLKAWLKSYKIPKYEDPFDFYF